MEHLIEIGIFAGKFFITLLSLGAIFLFVAVLVAKQTMRPELLIEDYNSKLDELQSLLESVTLNKKQLKATLKEKKKKLKSSDDEQRKKHVFLLDFDGDIKATAVDQLRDEVTAVLLSAQKGDEVIITIESPGGTVHGYGLAAAQLLRLKDAGLTVTASVDRVAASGGYMMACTAHKIIAAPFAIIGSIGVLAQVPNFHRLLKKHDVDYEEISSGDYKRTVSILGEITERGRQKFTEQIADTHELFKNFVVKERPNVNMASVGTGEYWFALRAKDLNLVDDITTVDDYLLKQRSTAAIYSIKYTPKKKLSDKINDLVGQLAERIYTKLNGWAISSRQL